MNLRDLVYQKEKESVLNTDGAFFTVRYTTPNSEWKHIKSCRSVLLEKAEEVAKSTSLHYIDSLVTVNVGDGDVVIEVWHNGELQGKDDELYQKFYGVDYSSYWGY